MAKGIDKKLDDAWSKLVKIRDGYKCQVCGLESTLNSHHIFTRSRKSTRWDVDNGITLCVSHHTFNHKFSAHITGVEFTHWLELKVGEEWLSTLQQKSHQIAKYSKADKEELLKGLLKEIEDYVIGKRNP